MINWVTDLLVPQLTSRSGIVFFIVLAFVYGYGSYFLLSFVTRNTREIREKNASIKRIHILVIASQIALSATLTYIIISIITSSKYYTASLIGASVISQFVTIFISVLFARTFFAWYKSNRNSIIVLIYGLSFAVNALTIAESSMLDIDAMLKKPPIITPDSEVVFPSDIYESGTLLRILSDNYQYSSAATFILVLTATALLLYNYIKRLGRAKYWILVLLPLLYQISTLLDTLGIYNPETDTELLYWYLYQSLNSTAGGILFGIAYWQVAKSIRQDSLVRNYLMIAAYGFVLYFITTQVTLYATSYPPFGFAAFSLLPLSSYLVFVGVYSSAISVSQDNKLRRSIKNIARKNSDLLGSIGAAQLSQETLRKIDSFKDVVLEEEKELEQKTGIEANIKEEDIKSILEEVLQEVGKTRKQS
jgi:hypothetical protein